MGALGLTGAQWRDGLLVGLQNGRQPISRSIIRDECGVGTIISGNITKSFLYNPADGLMVISKAYSNYFSDNYTIRLGGKGGVANTPVLQFHTGSSDEALFAGRIIVAGGIPTAAGSGVYRIEFRQTLLRETAPLAANSYTLGTAALPWAGALRRAPLL